VVARIALIVLAGVVLAGCYGSTEPATEVGAESAKLNARGTADNGPATSHFEFWITGSTRVRWTDDRHWPAGASGPFFEKVSPLAASSSYSFRVCGSNDGDHAGGCAQTRTFTTAAAVEDSAVGSWPNSPHFDGSVNAHSGPSGQNAHGTISARVSFQAFTGSVTCLLVAGNHATVGAVGNYPGEPGAKETMIATIVDGGPSAADTVNPSITEGSTTPPVCNPFTGSGTTVNFGPYAGEIVVNNAP
jgi:hypothetical protein